MTASGGVDEAGRARRGPLVDRWGLLAVPAAFLLGVFFVAPLAIMMLRSVTDPPGIGIGNYQTFAGSQADIRVLGTTFYIASVCTIVTLLIGYPYAYLMTIVPPRVSGVLLTVVLVPFWSSLLVRTFAWEMILRDTGVINSVLLDAGVIDQPLPLIRNTLGVVIGMSQILLPFMVVPLYNVMRRIDPEYPLAASNLGASPFSAFRRVFLPLSLPGVTAGALLVFVSALGFYITPTLLGSPRETMLSRFIADQVQIRLDWGLGSAMAVILSLVTVAILAVVSRFVRLRDVYGAIGEEA